MMSKKILAGLFDFDHCFYAENIDLSPIVRMHYKVAGASRIRNIPFDFKGPIVDHFCKSIQHLDPDEIQVSSFSNRQDFYNDNNNSNANVTHSSFVVFTQFVKYLGELFPKKRVIVNKFLLADTYMPEYEPGKVWDASIKVLKKSGASYISNEYVRDLPKPLSIRVQAHEYKTDMFYIKAHQMSQESGTVVHALVYDDFEQALNNIHQLYSANPDFLPRNFSADLFAFTSLTKINQTSGLSEKEMYFQQSILSSKAAPFYSAFDYRRDGRPIERGVIDIERVAKSDIFPGVDHGLPEHYPYQKHSSKVFYNKKDFVLSCLGEFHADGGNPLRDIKSYHEPKHTLKGTGEINKSAHLFHPQLITNLEKKLDPELFESWRNCNVLEPGVRHGVWAGNETLVDFYRTVIKETAIIDSMVAAFGSVKNRTNLQLWSKLGERHFSYLMMPIEWMKSR